MYKHKWMGEVGMYHSETVLSETMRMTAAYE